MADTSAKYPRRRSRAKNLRCAKIYQEEAVEKYDLVFGGTMDGRKRDDGTKN